MEFGNDKRGVAAPLLSYNTKGFVGILLGVCIGNVKGKWL